MNIFDAIILGIVEGLTEFLPISSTGHMILASELLSLEQTDVLKCFEVVIQLGSISAVVFMFFNRLKQDFNLWIKLIFGFIPTAIIGFIFYSHIKSFFNSSTVAYMLIIWGVIFILVEIYRKKVLPKQEVSNLDGISYKQAFIIGLSQCLAMIPGTSRSGATIITSLLCGLNRITAAKFSFLLAIPTMFAATFYDTYKNIDIFKENLNYIYTFLIGGLVAFLVALFAIKIFLNFIGKFDYIPFGIYRIIVGLIFLVFVL